MRNFLIKASPFFCALVLVFGGWTMLWQIFSHPLKLGAAWWIIITFLLIGLYTGIMVYLRSNEPKGLRTFYSLTSGLGVAFLLPLIGVGGCCAVYML
mgnify:CR=1 FL=1